MERQGRKVRTLPCRKIHVFFSNYYLEEDLKSCTLSGKQISGETWASEKLSIGLSALGPPGCLPACQMLETWSLSCAGGRSVYAESKQICPGDFFFPSLSANSQIPTESISLSYLCLTLNTHFCFMEEKVHGLWVSLALLLRSLYVSSFPLLSYRRGLLYGS